MSTETRSTETPDRPPTSDPRAAAHRDNGADNSPVITDGTARELLLGPQSITWRYASDARLYLVMLYPLLLQVAHPTVGAGVRDYSDFDKRPWNRLLRTLDYVYLLIYGGEQAISAGRRLRGIHKGFQGTREDGQRYYALEPKAYAWVHATLLHSYVAGHEHFGRPMRPDQIERFYDEYRGLGRLIGVRPGDLPPTWAEFMSYFDQTARTVLERNVTVDRVLRSVTDSTPPLPLPPALWKVLQVPASRALWLGGIGLVEPGLRRQLGIPWSKSDERAFRTLGAISRSLTPMMPAGLRTMGPGSLRVRRRAIMRGPLGPGRAVAARRSAA
jgi:uncharacterized protein (DUF2236 family)